MNKHILIIFLCFITSILNAQSKYWVFLSNKNGSTFDPYQYFDTKAIERYQNTKVSLYDSTNFPLNENYVSKISELVNEITSESRWFNCLAVSATESQMEELKHLTFVKSIEPIYLQTYTTEFDYDTTLTISEDELLVKQLARMNGKAFKDNNFDGTGIRIAIFDAGFPNVDKNPAFADIRNENRIIKTYDFAKKKDNVYDYNAHGSMVMSCIGGKVGDKQIGLATGAEFLLARTEIESEPFSEEENWLAAVEWADKNGAQIINSSLGYTESRYFTSDMNGKTSLVARAANLAARKGMLVVNAMGNDGDGKWKYVGSPADADSVLSVGGINPDTDYHTDFSSFGPTSDYRMKPNVVAYGHAIVASKDKLEESQGTSFSSPLIAGFAACAWQSNKSYTNMELMHAIEKSGDLYPYFDYAHGFGVPQANRFTTPSKEKPKETFKFELKDKVLYIIIDNKFITDGNNYLYYHLQNNEGYLSKYFLIDVSQSEIELFEYNELENGNIIRASYKGYEAEYKIN